MAFAPARPGRRTTGIRDRTGSGAGEVGRRRCHPLPLPPLQGQRLRLRVEHPARSPRCRGRHPDRVRKADLGDPQVRASRRSVLRVDPQGGAQRRARFAAPAPSGAPAKRSSRAGVRQTTRVTTGGGDSSRRSRRCPRISATWSCCATWSAYPLERSPTAWAAPSPRSTGCITAPAWPCAAS